MSDTSAFLTGGQSFPSCTFPAIGTRQGGRITEPAPFMQQQRDLQTGAPKFWDDGSPMQQLVVTVQTDQRDPSNPDDDGRRRLYVKGQMRNAVGEALRKVGANDVQVGGELWVDFISQQEPKARGFNGAKVYAATYTKPAASAGFFATPESAQQHAPAQVPAYAPAPAPAAYQPQAQPAQQFAAPAPVATAYQAQAAQQLPLPEQPAQQPAPAVGTLTPEQVAALQAMGMAPGQVPAAG